MTPTPEQMRIACAEVCGWKRIGLIEGDYHLMGDKPPLRGWQRIPAYHTDLNAMHEAVKAMSEDDRSHYHVTLCCMVGGVSLAIEASPELRLEAFLRVMRPEMFELTDSQNTL